MFIILLIAFIILLGIFLKLKYFTLRGPVPGIPPHFLLGNLLQIGLLSGISISEVYASLKKRFGDTYQLWLGFVHFIVVCNIDDVQHIFTHRHTYDQGDWLAEQIGVLSSNGLITLRGARYKRHGALIIPLFRHNKIISNFDLIITWTDKLLDKWRYIPDQHIHLDILEQCQNLILQIFGFIAFDYDFEALNGTTSNELTVALRNFLGTVEVASYIPSTLLKIYLRLNSRYQRARSVIQRYLYKMIEQELQESSELRAQRKKISLIASLVDSLQVNEKKEAEKSEEEKTGLSKAEVFDEMLIFLLLGYETTSTALAWSIHLLSKNPRVQQKIKSELMNENGDKALTLDHLDSLSYLDCVINEVLRFCPPIDGAIRTLTRNDRLPASGIQLYKGDQVIIPLHVLAQSDQLWKIDPTLFYPERFLLEDKNHHSYASLPFGSGHRQCMGQDLARFKLKVILARLMQCIHFHDGGSEVNSGGYDESLTIMPKHVGVQIEFDLSA